MELTTELIQVRVHKLFLTDEELGILISIFKSVKRRDISYLSTDYKDFIDKFFKEGQAKSVSG